MLAAACDSRAQALPRRGTPAPIIGRAPRCEVVRLSWLLSVLLLPRRCSTQLGRGIIHPLTLTLAAVVARAEGALLRVQNVPLLGSAARAAARASSRRGAPGAAWSRDRRHCRSSAKLCSASRGLAKGAGDCLRAQLGRLPLPYMEEKGLCSTLLQSDAMSRFTACPLCELAISRAASALLKRSCGFPAELGLRLLSRTGVQRRWRVRGRGAFRLRRGAARAHAGRADEAKRRSARLRVRVCSSGRAACMLMLRA
jgi:hypothetical protein